MSTIVVPVECYVNVPDDHPDPDGRAEEIVGRALSLDGRIYLAKATRTVELGVTA